MSRITDAVSQFRASQQARTCECGKPSKQSGIASLCTPEERKLLSFLDSQNIRFCSVECFRTQTSPTAAKKEA